MSREGTVVFTCDWCGGEEQGAVKGLDNSFEVRAPELWLLEDDQDFCSTICAARYLANKYNDIVKELEDEEKKKTGGTVRPITEEDLAAIRNGPNPIPGRVTSIGDA